MDEEKIIRDEAKVFHENEIVMSRKVQAIDDIQKLKYRLTDFYAPENKAIFLDEVEKQIKTALQEHRDRSHGGQPKADCGEEIKSEKLLYYIKQEFENLPMVAHQKNEIANTEKRTKVFVSYSHADSEFLDDIKRHFKPFLKNIEFWDDTHIKPGQKWQDEIKKNIESCKVAILLVSTDFLGSEFISAHEIPPLLKAAEENGATILTVILKPCLIEEFKDLNQYQFVNPPSKPVIKLDYAEKEELYVNLVRQTKRLLEL
ncbi:toll/interleukin-1 receptor domain-containing protein [Flavobacterium anhuiense]|uniref:toll/interleukin-1 receptor domain-containing protein n=1 Tax=Flavobacterium anhuiense TaxID=459526 RepID=UPI003D956FE0